MGPLVNRRAVDNMMDGIRRIREQGGEILFGGERMLGNYVQPTLVRARPDMPILKEEIFAPILYIVEFDDLDQAIRWHNDVPQGLSSAMFTTSLISSETFLSHRGSDCGIANINLGHQRSGDRRRLRRRKGNRRRARIRQRLLESIHAPADQHHQLVGAIAARAGDSVH